MNGAKILRKDWEAKKKRIFDWYSFALTWIPIDRHKSTLPKCIFALTNSHTSTTVILTENVFVWETKPISISSISMPVCPMCFLVTGLVSYHSRHHRRRPNLPNNLFHFSVIFHLHRMTVAFNPFQNSKSNAKYAELIDEEARLWATEFLCPRSTCNIHDQWIKNEWEYFVASTKKRLQITSHNILLMALSASARKPFSNKCLDVKRYRSPSSNVKVNKFHSKVTANELN